MSLGSIIRQKREELGYTLDEVSNRIGFSKPYLSTIETGKVKNPPSDEVLTKLEKTLGFKMGMLLYLGHMEGLPSDIREGFESVQSENQKWREVAKDLMDKKLNPAQVKRLLSKKKLKVKQDKVTIAAGRQVPIINKVTAGYPRDFDDMDYPVGVADDYIRCPDLHDPNAFAVRVVGDSMEPKFKENDIVIFSPAADVNNGDDCFVRFATPHETTFKRVFFEKDNNIRLQPRNAKYSPAIVEGKRINGIYRAIIKHEML
ncbi:MAG: LexA family transcriptional regulator [Planctomycetota bacterium]|nr:LexA family transcriptional regulator [Planctomycetota bacterium]